MNFKKLAKLKELNGLSIDNSVVLTRAHNFPQGLWLRMSLLAGIFVLVYFETIISFIKTWIGRDDYSHGFLVPLVSLYFVWAKRENIRNVPIKPNIPMGFIFVFLGGVMLILGTIGSTVMVQQISILFTIPGMVFLLAGKAYLKALILPLFYLIFMIPSVLDIAISRLHWPAQLFSAAIAAKALSLMNVPVFHSSTLLELPNVTLEVANICSGVRYLISIIALGIPLAYLTQSTFFKKVLLVLLAVLVGIIMNPLRIFLIGIWAYHGGEVTHGPMHIFQGLFVSVVGFFALFLFAWVLAGPSSKNTAESQKKNIESKNEFYVNMIIFNRGWIVLIVLLLSFSGVLYAYTPVPVPLKSSLSELPIVIGNWHGRNEGKYSRLVEIENADEEINRRYRDNTGSEINLQISYFKKQKQGSELIQYKLQNLYENAERIEIPIDSGSSIQVNKAIITDGHSNFLVFYWYTLNGKVFASNYEAKLSTAIEGLVYRRTNGAIVIIFSRLNNQKEYNKVLDQEIEFIKKYYPYLKLHAS